MFKGSRYIPGGPTEQWLIDITWSLDPEEAEYKCGAHRAVRRWAIRIIGLCIHCKMSLIGSCTKCWGLHMVVLCWKAVEALWDGPSLREVVRSWFPSLSSSFAYSLPWTEYLAPSSICCHHVMFVFGSRVQELKTMVWNIWNSELKSIYNFFRVFLSGPCSQQCDIAGSMGVSISTIESP